MQRWGLAGKVVRNGNCILCCDMVGLEMQLMAVHRRVFGKEAVCWDLTLDGII